MENLGKLKEAIMVVFCVRIKNPRKCVLLVYMNKF